LENAGSTSPRLERCEGGGVQIDRQYGRRTHRLWASSESLGRRRRRSKEAERPHPREGRTAGQSQTRSSRRSQNRTIRARYRPCPRRSLYVFARNSSQPPTRRDFASINIALAEGTKRSRGPFNSHACPCGRKIQSSTLSPAARAPRVATRPPRCREA